MNKNLLFSRVQRVIREIAFTEDTLNTRCSMETQHGDTCVKYPIGSRWTRLTPGHPWGKLKSPTLSFYLFVWLFCVWVWGCVHAVTHIWQSEDNPEELVLPLYYVESNSGHQAQLQALCSSLLSFLTGSYYVAQAGPSTHRHSSCLSLLSAGVTGVSRHTQLKAWKFLKLQNLFVMCQKQRTEDGAVRNQESMKYLLDVVASKLSTLEVEAGKSGVPGQPGLYSKCWT